MPLPIGPDYHFHIRTAADPAISADGSGVAFTVRYYAARDPSAGVEERADVYVAAVPATLRGLPGATLRVPQGGGGGEPRLLVENAERPAWSPDGKAIAFLRKDGNGNRQVWIAEPDGTSARQVTSQPGIDCLTWAPDSVRIAYRADVAPDGPSVGRGPSTGSGRGPSAESPGSSPGSGSGRARPMVARRIRYHMDGAGWRGDAFHHLFVIDVTSGVTMQLTDGDADDGPPVWSPDGSRIAFISDRGPFRDTTARNEVYVVPSTGGPMDRWSGGLFMAGSIAWSPDGTKMAVVGAEQPEQVGGHGLTCQGWIYVLEPGMYPDRLTDDSVRPIVSGAGHPISGDIYPMYWSGDGRVVFVADARGQSYVCSVPVDGGAVTRHSAGGEQVTGWAAREGVAVVAANTPQSVGELYAVALDRPSPSPSPLQGEGTRSARLTSLNDQFLADHPPARLEKFTVVREDHEVECRLWLPPDFDPSRRYPLLLDVHGGPHSVFYDAFYPIHQIGATNGYVVLAPNPRGSSSYGLEFAAEVHGDWGGGDYLDVMAAVTEAVKRPYLDENRVVIHGSSYGGYMASWAVGHSDRFKAAVIAAPVTDLPSFYGTSDIGVNFSEVQFGGRRADNLSWYIRHSPLTYAANVNTPVLLLHGEDDRRVAISQSEQYFVALKRAGKAVEFVRLPGTSHGIFRAKDPFIRQEYFARMLAWFARWLPEGAARPGPEGAPTDGRGANGATRRPMWEVV